MICSPHLQFASTAGPLLLSRTSIIPLLLLHPLQAVDLKDCELYSYQSDLDTDPFGEQRLPAAATAAAAAVPGPACLPAAVHAVRHPRAAARCRPWLLSVL